MKRKEATVSVSMALILAMTMGLAGCGSQSAGTDSSVTTSAESESTSSASTGKANTDKFTIGMQSDIPSMDPAQCNDYISQLVINNMYDTLLRFSPDGTELLPGLAESWEQTDDTTYVYEIRDDVKFWDGNPMTVDDVIYSIEYQMDPDNASLVGYMYDPIESIEQTGDYEMTIKLSQPSASFRYIFATIAGAVMEKSYVEDHPDDFGTPSGGIMATGPYELDTWTEGTSITMKKNPDYWDDSVDALFDNLEFDVIEDESSRALALTNGQVDFINSPPYDVYNQIDNSSNADLVTSEGLEDYYLSFNCSRGPLQDVNARKAVATAIDRKAISDSLLGEGRYTIGGALDFDPEVLGYDTENWTALQDELDDYSYDLDKAKEYLAQSDYPDGFEITMPVVSGAASQRCGEAAQYYLSQIGITLNLETVTMTDWYSIAYGSSRDSDGHRDYDIFEFGWIPDYNDPVAFLKLYLSSAEGVGGANISAYQNPDFDELVSESESEQNETKRSEIMQDAYRMQNADCPGLILSYHGPQYGVNSAYNANLGAQWFWSYRFTQVTEK